jgi:hypothetical protein
MAGRRSRRSRSGFSLAEYIIGMGVGSIVLVAVAGISLYSGRSFAGLANYSDLNATSLHAIDYMTRDIRQAVRLQSFTTNQLVLGFQGSSDSLVFTYSPTDRTLIRQHGADRKVLLKDCDYLNFSVFQRSPIAGTYDQFPAALPGTGKVIEVTWSCSRKILGSKINSENAQTAKIVIRKH